MNFLKKMADTSRRYLAGQTISADGPGTIVADAEAMIAFIGEAGLTGKSRNGNLPAEVLPALNDRLAEPVRLGLKRPLLRDYPNLAGIFVLLRVMDLVRAEGRRVEINPAALAVWRGLNGTEKYFALLEAWLWRADAAVLGGDERRRRSQAVANLGFLIGLKTGTWREFVEYCHTSEFAGAVSTWNTQLHMRFGLVEVEERAPARPNGRARQPGRGWTMERARRTRWGQAVAWVVLGAITNEDDELGWMLDVPAGADFGFLQPAFQPFFPEWEKLFETGPAEARPGLYVFKVTMTDRRAGGVVWRRLAVPGGVRLDAVAGAVLEAFDFEDTLHLYEFRFRDRLGKGRVYHDDEAEEGPYADDVALEALNLPDGTVMAFRFDSGDDWRFEVRLERVEPPGKAKIRITLLESAGEAPEQYPD
jgi:hypothetical protein